MPIHDKKKTMDNFGYLLGICTGVFGMSDFGLNRFIPKHREHFAEAISELKAGQKIGCWSWYLLPTPFRENASEENKRFALKSDDEARAYLTFSERGVDLGQS